MLARISVKKPYTVIVAIILVIALGVISFMNMTTDLLPSMNLPYVIVYTVDTGATPETIESDVTRPLEEAFATLTDIQNITSTSSENLSLVVLEFSGTADMNTAMIEINSHIQQVSGAWDDDIGTPVVMKLNPDMIPVTVSTVSFEGKDLLALSDYVQDTLIPAYEAVDGVASVTASGVMTQQVDITIEQNRIDILNNKILREVDSKLADTEDQLREARRQISSGKRMLSSMRGTVMGQIDEALAAIDNGSTALPGIIADLTAKRETLATQFEGARTALAGLEAVGEMTDEQKAQALALGDTIKDLESQKAALEKSLESGSGASALETQLETLKTQRDGIAALEQGQRDYIASLTVLDSDMLKKTIKEQEADLKAAKDELAAARPALEQAITDRDQAKRDIADLKSRIRDLEPDYTDPDDNKEEEPEAPKDDPAEDGQASGETPEEGNNGDTSGTDPEGETPAEGAPESGQDGGSGSDDQNASEEPKEEETGDKPAEDKSAEKPSEEKPAEEKSAEKPAEGSRTDESLTTTSRRFTFGSVACAEEVKTLDDLKRELAEAKVRLSAAQADVDTYTERCEALNETLNSLQNALEESKTALDELENGNQQVQTKIDEANALIESYAAQKAALDAQIESITQALSDGSESEVLAGSIAALDAQITAIKESDAYRVYQLVNDKKAYKSQLEQAQGAVAQLEAGIVSIDSMLEKLNQGIIPGGLIDGMAEDTKLSDARQQLVDARAQAVSGFASGASKINEAETKINEAWKEFTDARDEALEKAGIDGIVTVQTISGILGAQNLDLPAGYVSDADGRYLVSVGTEFASLEELRQVKLFSLGMDTVDDIRLLDVASVAISDNSEDLFTMVNGDNGIMLSFEKQSTASTAEVADRITEKSEQLMAEEPGLKVLEMFNQGDYIDLIVDSVLQNLLVGGLLAVFVLLLFLLDWRPTLIVAISIPVSVVVAFVGMYFAGISLNVMSLSGLALGVGMLVDNSIVAIENIYRLINEEHLPVLTASIRGVKQVGGALIASTLTTICVFLPIVFIHGTARDLFQDMGLTFAFALLASLLVAMTVVPSFSAGLFKKAKPREHKLFNRFRSAYTALLRGALKVKVLVLLLAIGLMVFSGYKVMDMSMSLMPTVNSSQMEATLSFADDTLTEEQQQAIAADCMTAMLDTKNVTDVALTGSSSLSMLSSMRGGGSGSYSYYLLVETGDRKNSEIASDIRSACAQWCDGTSVTLDVQESTMDMSTMTGTGISVNISGSDMDVLRSEAQKLAAICATVEGAVNVDDGLSESEPKLVITVDKELASDNGLTVAQVYQYIAQRLYGGVKLTDATLDGREYTLYVYTDENIDLAPEDLENMEIEVAGTADTKQVRIGDIATIENGMSLQSIGRSNQTRRVKVSFELAEGYASNLVSRELEEKLKDYKAPDGYSVSLSGENEKLMEYMKDLIYMVGIAVLFIFLIMVAQFQSFKSPIIVMITIPLAFTGGLLALILTRMDLSVIALVGFLMLSGVVVNNGIVFIDGVNQLRIAGMAKKDALIETGRVRLRPILMSVLTTVLGMIPMAFGTGMGAEMMQPMAVVIIGGLSYSTLMTLFVVPILYDLFNGEKMKARELEMAKEAAGLEREDFKTGTAEI